MEKAKRQVSSMRSLEQACLSRKVSQLTAAIAGAEHCGLPKKITEAARIQLTKEYEKAECLEDLKAARKSRDADWMASAAGRATALGVNAPKLTHELASHAESMLKSKRRKNILKARDDLQRCADLRPKPSKP